MCSTPRPKRTIKGSAKTTGSGAILSGLSAQKRAAFVQCANQADDRRQEIKQQALKQQSAAQAQQRRKQKHLSLVNNNTLKNNRKSWRYWLVDASIKEIIFALFFIKAH
ncbi:MAG: hypothetical protein COB35_12040 [Gammaproteobacteria bacterium]|nr:MAG: hypothetical protein COB35_12040 [Gammaproteobacteria bacterium]